MTSSEPLRPRRTCRRTRRTGQGCGGRGRRRVNPVYGRDSSSRFVQAGEMPYCGTFAVLSMRLAKYGGSPGVLGTSSTHKISSRFVSRGVRIASISSGVRGAPSSIPRTIACSMVSVSNRGANTHRLFRACRRHCGEDANGGGNCTSPERLSPCPGCVTRCVLAAAALTPVRLLRVVRQRVIGMVQPPTEPGPGRVEDER
jgi:hypothetical protein